MKRSAARYAREKNLSAQHTSPAEIPPLPHTRCSTLVSLLSLGALTLLMFAEVLFSSKATVLSNGTHSDLALEYIGFMKFGFGEMRQGNLPLWNPHIFSGVPLLSAFESGVLYPLNALLLVLPIHTAINWSIALHVFLAGAFTYAWTARRKLQPPACFLAAMIFMFCGANFLHIYSGSYPLLCTVAWIPLLFLAIDGMTENPCRHWALLGMFAAAMQVFAGAPQLVFYSGMAAGVYCLLLLWQTRTRGRVLIGFAAIGAGAAGLSAIQLFTSLQETAEMVRGDGVSYDYAAMFSFPPENLLTFLVPDLFGDMKKVAYWGRCYLWEMSAYLSVPGFFLAMIGGIWGDKSLRRFSVTMVAVLVVLALGYHTPLFDVLYNWAPGFNRFRGSSKFFILASLFLTMLAGVGFNELLKGRRIHITAPAVAALMGSALVIAGWIIRNGNADGTGWHSFMLWIRDQGESYLPPATYENPEFVHQAASIASSALLLGGGACVLFAFLLWASRNFRLAIWLMLLITITDLFYFGRKSLDHFDLAQIEYLEAREFLETHPGDYRILDLRDRNVALSIGARDIWGYNPAVLRRYSELVGFTQGVPPERATQYVQFTRDHRLLDMLRCRFIFLPQNGDILIRERTNHLSHLLLLTKYQVMTNRNDIFTTLTHDSFDPRAQVLLETFPNPEPYPSTNPGTVKLLDSSTDHLTIAADIHSPCLLLITDTYAQGWKARGLPGSVRNHYNVLPANYCLRGIPLSSGKHIIRLEYIPESFRIGRWFSLISWAIFSWLILITFVRRFGKSQ